MYANENLFKGIIIGFIIVDVFYILCLTGLHPIISIIESLLVAASIIAGSRIIIRISRSYSFNFGVVFIPLIHNIEIMLRSGSTFNDYILLLFIIFIGSMITYLSSIYISGKGIYGDIIVLITTNSILSNIYASLIEPGRDPVQYSTIISYFSTLIGLDILNLLSIKQSRVVIGGRGLLDALIITTYLTPPLTLLLHLVAM